MKNQGENKDQNERMKIMSQYLFLCLKLIAKAN